MRFPLAHRCSDRNRLLEKVRRGTEDWGCFLSRLNLGRVDLSAGDTL